MELNKIFEIIDKKVQEHKVEIEGTVKEMYKLQDTLKALIKDKEKSLTENTKLFILRDKLTFHKACAASLVDLKEEITKGGNNVK